MSRIVFEADEPQDEVLFASLIKGCVRINYLNLLSNLMQRYWQKACSVNLTAPAYGFIIKTFGRARHDSRLRELWNDMEERSIKPTPIMLGCMAETLATDNQVKYA